MTYIQKSNFKPKVNSNSNENNMYYDIKHLLENSNNDFIYANGFKVTSCLKGNIVLPENATVTYAGPLSICVGASLTIPNGTTLTVT